MEKDTSQKLFAFWKYDLPPYYCGGEIVSFNEKGDVETKEYGKGLWVKPIKVLPLEAGKEIAKQLGELRAEAHAAEKELRERLRTKAELIFNQEDF